MFMFYDKRDYFDFPIVNSPYLIEGVGERGYNLKFLKK